MPIASMRASVRLSLSRKESVDALRKKIDQIDAKIVGFLNDRATLAQRIGHNKRLSNQEVYVPNREQEILHRVSRLNRGPLSEQVIRSVFREVIAACRSLESPLKVAFFGAEATFTHLAAREKFGAAITSVPTASISEVFQEVRQGRVSFGVVPIENSTEGVVAYTLDLLVDSDLKICAEIFLVIHHNVLSRSGRAEDIRKIVSHPQALAQSDVYLRELGVEIVATYDTAGSARMISTELIIDIHANRGRRLMVMPGARSFHTVVIMLMPVPTVPMPTISNPAAQ